MRLAIENVRGIESWAGQIVPGTVTSIALPNGQGKTTIAACLAALMARDPDPLGLGTSLRGGYVRTGADPESAIATLEGQSWTLTWHVAAGQFAESGPVFPPPPAIVGRAMRPAWRQGSRESVAQAWLEALIVGEFTQSEIADAIRDALGNALEDGGERIAAQLAADVIADPIGGWKRCADYCHERILEAKRGWRAVVAKDGDAESYGSRKAANWRPKAWHPDLEQGSVTEAERVAHEAREAQIDARDKLAAFDSRVETWESARAEVAALESDREDMRARLRDIEAADAGERIAEAEQRVNAARSALADAEPKAMEAAQRHDAAAEDAEQLSQALEEKRDAHRVRQREFADAKRKHMDNMNALNKAREAFKELTQLAEASADGTCPTCGQPVYDESVATRAAQARERLPEAEADIGDAEAQHGHSAEAVGQCEAALAAASREEAEAFAKLSEVNLVPLALASGGASAKVSDLRRELAHAEEELSRAKFATPPDTAELRGEIRALGRIIAEKGAGEKPDGRDRHQQLVDHAGDGVARATRDLNALRIHQEAQMQHRLAGVWTAAHDVLSPEKGIRRSRLEYRVGKLNDFLAQFAGMLTLPHLQLSPNNLRIAWGRRAIDLASASEQWLAAAFVRTALAAMHHAPAAILDGADIVQPSRRDALRESLAQLAQATKIAVLWTETRE